MKIAVIGGGAAGLMAAATIVEADSEAEVFLIEKNEELGKKVIISGGGRCNLTTGFDDIKQILTKYPRGGKFLTKAMYAFPPKAVRNWFEAHGVTVKIEGDMRAFPVSDDGQDVVGVFEKSFKKGNVKVMINSAVEEIKKDKKGFSIKIKKRLKPLTVDKVILTTGGQAYRQTGSTGDGYTFAVELGHSITPLAPSLSAFHTKESWTADVAGLSFKKVELNIGKRTTVGPVMFTHKGVTGPAVFAMSSLIAFEELSTTNPILLTMDIFPDLKIDKLNAKLSLLLHNNPKKNLSSVLSLLVPKSLAMIVCDEVKIDFAKNAGQVSKKEVEVMVEWMKKTPLHIIARSAGEEFVTAGGVDLNEINPSTMESKKCPGLYLAGEILDIDGFTGGFNLQSAWATGRLAGTNLVLSHSTQS
ncbi:MAG: NAD(P)/FAD-dependent oxidoreductase [Patescibacteria group bacterium]|nr:NAD(P)/FAD-dependent oxidoreductase [Patescibacteria group bacterium]